MRVLVVTQYYSPENFLINDVVKSLKSRGHYVEVLTAIPNYPEGKFYKGYNFFNKHTEIIEGDKINRSRLIPRMGANKISLSLNYLCLFSLV